MLGVLKRRLKPKRSGEKETQNGRKNGHGKSEAIVPVDMARITSSQRQIHPLFEEKAQLLAYDDVTCKKPAPTPSLKRSPDDPLSNPLLQLPKKPSEYPAASPGSPVAVYHPAPNICVEGGRIEFIKSPSEGSALHANASPLPENGLDKKGSLYQSSGLPHRKSVVATATRAQQTQADIGDFVEADEKCDIAKEFLEARIKELERLLEAEQKSGQRERLAVARLQRQLARREVIHRDVDRERRLRADTESRLRETVVETERYRATLAGLQREFSRMEDTVRTMLQYKSRCELLNQEKASLAAAYENRVHQYQNTITKLNQENESLRHQLRLLETTGSSEIQSSLLERLRSLETENVHISQDADFQRKQYEKCLDDIANQVVRALLSQKGLREEIGNLQRRIKELENQNLALSNILVRKFEGGEATNALVDKSWFPGSYGEKVRSPSSMASSSGNDKNLLKNAMRSPLETLILPLQRPRSLNLYLHASRIPVSSVTFSHRKSKLNLVHLNKKPTEDEGNESPESGNKDEGYSTMSSDVQGPGDSNELSKRELEDLKETSDETEMVKLETGSALSVVLVEDISNPDIFFIPFNFTLAINPRHSYPPTKDFLPFQHIIRSFSDSHLCLKLNANSPLLTAPMNPSVLFVDLVDKNNPLRRSKATNSLLSKEEEILQELEETQSSAGSWCSGAAEGCWWDTEYIQHCVRLDDVRLKPQKDILHLDYDNTELEDWSLSLSCEDIAKGEASTPGTLPCAQDAEVAHLTVDTKESTEMTSWNSAQSMESPGGSWSSGTSNNSDYCCHSLNEACFNECSKRSSVASDDAESSLVGTDFTRDFYRLVKFESTKSLASNSSRSIANGDVGIRDSQSQEPALRNVLSFIAEQQQYCHSREEEDTVLQTCSTEQCKSDQCSDERKCKPDVAETTETESLNCSLQETSQTKCEEVADDTRTELYDNCTELPNIQENVTSFTVGSLMTISEEANDESAESPAREQPQSPRRHESLIPVPKPSPRTKPPQHRKSLPQKSRLAGTKIPVKSSSKKSESSSVPKTSEIKSPKASSARETNIPVPTAKKAEVSKKVKSPEVSKVVVADDGSFHERATSKDVIDELNRMIRKGEEVTPGSTDGDMKPLDVACCCPTGWVHVERDIDFTDPKARANLLDVMLASSGSSGGSGSSSDSGGEDPVNYSHLHRLHRFRRQRKGSSQNNPQKSPCLQGEMPSPEVDVATPVTPTTPISPSDDSDERTGGQVSLSDSCANSFTESTGSLEDPC